jgi:general secretion pathway protein E
MTQAIKAAAAEPAAWAVSPIGALLVTAGVISQADVEKALAFQGQYGGRLGSILIRMGALSEDTLLPVLAEQLGLNLATRQELPEQPADFLNAVKLSRLPKDWFLDQQAILWEGVDGVIHCASRHPTGSYLQEVIVAAFPDRQLAWHLIRGQDLEHALKLLQQGERPAYEDEISQLRELAEEAPVVELVNNSLSQAIDEGASDIHLEPEEDIFHIRYRIDGVLQLKNSLPRQRYDAIASRIKLISGMDIAERRLPQDGRISIRASGTEMDIRVSVVPGVHGETIVMRLLPKERRDIRLEALGFENDHLEQFARWVHQPHGIVLVTGPTGSGKSTTLYTGLAVTNDRSKKIITVEDPVEYQMAGVTQIQAHSEIGYDFARALRAILRQDPDVIMIGEIRDLETAEIAVQAALTGHLVLSTLHTNDAVSAFTRLIDMGIEPFLVSSSVIAIQAQRLLRRLCPHCARDIPPPAALASLAPDLKRRYPVLLDAPATWKEAVGCPACSGTGYRGRIGIYELLDVGPELQTAVMRRASSGEILDIARRHGYRNLREDGLIKAWRGITSVDEVLRVTGLSEISA